MPYIGKRHNSVFSIGNVGLHGSGIGQELLARERRVAVLLSGLEVEEEQPEGLHLVHRIVLPVVVVVAQVDNGLALYRDVHVVVDLAAGQKACQYESCEQYWSSFHVLFLKSDFLWFLPNLRQLDG